MWIKKLLACGVNNILINTHYKSKQVTNHINNNYYLFPKIKTTYEKNSWDWDDPL